MALTRKQWKTSMERAFAATLPDNHPHGVARVAVLELLENGDYEKYARGEYAPDKLWEP